LEVPVTSRLRELIQQLGEAIHESVIESDQIAGVVQDIRKHGFVNADKADESADTDAETSGEPPFTKNDLHFLQSLRISVAGEVEGAQENDTE
jgi:hypothetical protein